MLKTGAEGVKSVAEGPALKAVEISIITRKTAYLIINVK